MQNLRQGYRSPPELVSDSAVYRRTQQGQRRLICAEGSSETLELRVLARVNGFTNLRQLVDLAPQDAMQIGHAIQRLVQHGFIEFVE